MVTILVVDDSTVDRRLAGGLLEKHVDWNVVAVKNGKEGLLAVRQKMPDVVVTDLQMPDMDGLELVKAIHQEFPLLPVILMTAQGSEAIAVQALEHGAASYVPKRLLGEMLVDTVDRVLSLAGERRSKRTLFQSIVDYRCEFVVGNDHALLTSLIAHLQQLVGEMKLFTDSELLRVGVALEEALLNAAYHGNLEVSSHLRELDHSAYYDLARQRLTEDPYSKRQISVVVELSRKRARYTIRDEGLGFDPKSLPDPTDPANLERPSGRGLLLMRTFMDEISYNERGNQVMLVKNRVHNT